MTTCQKCGGQRLAMIHQVLHLQTFRCEDCGDTTHSRIYPAEEVAHEPPVRVRFVWSHAEPNAHDAAAVRKLCSAAGNIAISNLLDQLRAKRVWDAGVHSRYHAMELRKRA